MIDPDQILAQVDRIVERFNPQRVILYGSHAWGTPTDDSDVDLLIVIPYRGESHRMATAIRSAVDPPFAMDLLVRNPQEIRQRLLWNDYFLKEVTEQGMVLHDAVNPGMGREGRERLRRRFALVSGRQAAV